MEYVKKSDGTLVKCEKEVVVTPPKEEETKQVDLAMANGNQVVTPTSSGKVMTKVTINKPSTLIADNIKKDINIGGVVGAYQGDAQLVDFTATFKVENSNYQVVSVKSGNQVAKPYNNPSISGKVFQNWYDSASGGNIINFPYTPTENIDMYARFIDGQIATISGLGNSSPSSVTFDVPDDFKFTDGEYVDDDGNIFIKIPKMYRKINTVYNNQITGFSLANAKIDDNYKIFPVFLKEDGVTELDWVGIGKYMNSSSVKVCSVASTNVQTMTLGNARNNIKSNYSYGKYQLYDWMFHVLWQNLIITKMKTVNTNSGSGIQTDQLGIYWGNSYQWIDGFGRNGTNVYLCDKPSQYVDSPTSSTSGYFTVNYTIPSSNNYIVKLGYDSNHPFVNLPNLVGGSSSTYYCDYYYYYSGNHPFSCDVGFASADFGAFVLNGSYDWTNLLGVRLCYRPLDD